MKTNELFPITPYDQAFYHDRLQNFLPEKMIDIHTHCWKDEFHVQTEENLKRAVTWPSLVAQENPIEDLLLTYEMLFPGKTVKPLLFGQPDRSIDLNRSNQYVSDAAARHELWALLLATPEWPAELFEQKLCQGNFVGAKVYLNFAPLYIPGNEIRIFDFIPHHQLDILNKHQAILMLHIPRSGRLKDPLNLAQVREIDASYPNIKLILAHVGRAYCAEDVGDAFDVLAPLQRIYFDFSANTNFEVFRALIQAVGPQRILFGSDLPILRMRMHRICENGRYINLVPRGLYGDISADPNMREADDGESRFFTFFMYEEIDAMRQAVEACGLDKEAVRWMFYENADHLLGSPGKGCVKKP